MDSCNRICLKTWKVTCLCYFQADAEDLEASPVAASSNHNLKMPLCWPALVLIDGINPAAEHLSGTNYALITHWNFKNASRGLLSSPLKLNGQRTCVSMWSDWRCGADLALALFVTRSRVASLDKMSPGWRLFACPWSWYLLDWD